MEAIIIQKDQFMRMMARIEEIQDRVEKLTTNQSFLDNCEFIQMMKISKRTAQTWRDEKRISYSQIGAKIYYHRKDIERLLLSNYFSVNHK